MKYKKLANTNLDVSLISLGTMTYGEQNTEAEAHEQLDYSIANGVNLDHGFYGRPFLWVLPLF